MSSGNIKGLVLALSSSVCIGASFIIKKKGLKKSGGSGVRAGVGGYSYLYEPLWWSGMITTYAFAPAILVTPLGALGIIIRYNLNCPTLVTANHLFILQCCTCTYNFAREATHFWNSWLCFVRCGLNSTTIVLHAPQEREISYVTEVWDLATERGFLLYTALVITLIFILVFDYIPQYGQTHIMCYIGVCSLVGHERKSNWNFFEANPRTWDFTVVVILSMTTQLNYLNKAIPCVPSTMANAESS